ncbi:MAG: lipid-A-disaccharide synthase [Gammaproteobacteria bacterium]|nr:lipid-A-disaccharide synthase [Gammaproteobacteria bacterium]MBT8093953.1 lipid-A-disaccharide synthase [Gammaproteobacteria bacterium]NNF50691.1 lipid-A-disaccharide synthase [Woeseiaceae bacterium]NNL63409.1 lipid-A-disaccharide synthase [Woeseiaceae bacterium]
MRFGLVAGEASGDVLGAGLIRAIRSRVPEAVFEGVAGTQMAAAGCEVWEPSESLAVMGLVEPLRHVPRLMRLRRGLVRRWTASPPDVFIGIDAPDFNLGLETKLRAAGIRTAHYVSPTIWVWRAGRARKVARAADTLLCILPFEPALYEDHDVNAVFVGHPKADEAPGVVDVQAARGQLGIAASEVVAVMPGSRSSEVARLGGLLAATMRRLGAARPELHFVIPAARPDLRDRIAAQLAEAGVDRRRVTLLDGQAMQAMSAADVVLQASGTAVLEAAMLRKPSVATYRVAPFTYWLGRHVFRIRLEQFTLPNLLTQEPLVPEFIQGDAEPGPLADAVLELLDDPQRRQFISERFDRLRRALALDADQRAADAVLELVRP